MTVERFLGYAEAKGVDIDKKTEEDLKQFQSELEQSATTEVDDQTVFSGPSVLEVCKKALNILHVRAVFVETTEGTCYENFKSDSEEMYKEVFAFALNGWVATYNTEVQYLTLIKA